MNVEGQFILDYGELLDELGETGSEVGSVIVKRGSVLLVCINWVLTGRLGVGREGVDWEIMMQY